MVSRTSSKKKKKGKKRKEEENNNNTKPVDESIKKNIAIKARAGVRREGIGVLYLCVLLLTNFIVKNHPGTALLFGISSARCRKY